MRNEGPFKTFRLFVTSRCTCSSASFPPSPLPVSSTSKTQNNTKRRILHGHPQPEQSLKQSRFGLTSSAFLHSHSSGFLKHHSVKLASSLHLQRPLLVMEAAPNTPPHAVHNSASHPLYLAIDVGTGSVRAGLFTAEGHKLQHSESPIKTRNARPDHYEQSTDDIWRSIVQSVRSITEYAADVYPNAPIAAIGVDATCSLVACRDDSTYDPISLALPSPPNPDQNVDGVSSASPAGGVDSSSSDGDVYNVMLWLDRRAIAEAAELSERGAHDDALRSVVDHFGGTVSPESQTPKLLWLLRNCPNVIREAAFFDLADWLAFRLGAKPTIRSACTVACKWGWGAGGGRAWSADFWAALGLDVLTEDNFSKIGQQVLAPGAPAGFLSKEAAAELQLSTQCAIASPMIDAYAGCLWSLGAQNDVLRERAPLVEQRVNMVAGTSTCFLQLSREPVYVHGVWGPFRDAVAEGFHVTEGGQSVSGKLLENCIHRHASFNGLLQRVGAKAVYKTLTDMTEDVVRNGDDDPATHVHCLDYHAGNRSPIADASLTGCFVGLTLGVDEWDLAVKFRATMQALCCGARHILEEMRKSGHDMRVVMACGGLCKSDMLLQELADSVGMPVVLCDEEDTVLLGGAILARTAHEMIRNDNGNGNDKDNDKGGREDGWKLQNCLMQTAREMTVGAARVITPNDGRKSYCDAKYAVYRRMHRNQLEYRRIMASGEVPADRDPT